MYSDAWIDANLNEAMKTYKWVMNMASFCAALSPKEWAAVDKDVLRFINWLREDNLQGRMQIVYTLSGICLDTYEFFMGICLDTDE